MYKIKNKFDTVPRLYIIISLTLINVYFIDYSSISKSENVEIIFDDFNENSLMIKVDIIINCL